MEIYREVAEKFAAKHLGVEGHLDALGEGTFAEVFGAGDKVVKVTRDKHDAIIAQRTVGKGFKHIVKNFGVYQIQETIDDDTIFIIVNERLKPMRDSKTYERYKPYVGVCCLVDKCYIYSGDEYKDSKWCEKHFQNAKGRVLEHNSSQLTSEDVETMEESIPQFVRMMGEIASLNVNIVDFHEGNIGYDDIGSVKFLDLGYHNSNGDSRGIKTIEL